MNQLEQSVPALLDGMKLAFTTSITGIATSLAYKFVLAFADRAGKNTEQVTPSDILSELKKINEKPVQLQLIIKVQWKIYELQSVLRKIVA